MTDKPKREHIVVYPKSKALCFDCEYSARASMTSTQTTFKCSLPVCWKVGRSNVPGSAS